MAKKKEPVEVVPKVSSFTARFKRARADVSTDASEVKLEHRQNLKDLMNKYFEDVKVNKAEGIKNVKELVDVMKLDLLMMGENTESIRTTSDIDEVKLTRVSQNLDLNDPSVQAMVNSIFSQINDDNDSADSMPDKENLDNYMSEMLTYNESVADEINRQELMESKDAIEETTGEITKGFEEM